VYLTIAKLEEDLYANFRLITIGWSGWSILMIPPQIKAGEDDREIFLQLKSSGVF
jgi:hypothetical protein